MLKLLFLLSREKGSATYVRAYNLARQLALRGHNITLMSVSLDSTFKKISSFEHGIEILDTPNLSHNLFGKMTTRLFLEPGTGVLDIYERIKIGMFCDFDIIQTFDHSLNVVVPFYFMRNRKKAKFVSDWCDVFHHPGGLRETYGFRLDHIYRKLGFPFRKYFRSLEVDFRRKVDAVTVISPKLKEFAINHEIKDENVFVIEGGADVDKIKPLIKKEARKALNIPVDSKIVGFLGTFQRDLDIVIKSMVLIKKEIPHCFLLVIGKPFPWTRQTVESHGIADSYIETGYCSDDLLPQYLSCVDVFALPFKKNLANETRWPNKIGEYMASGRPTVVSNVGDVARVVNDMKIGYVAEQRPGSFAEKLKEILTNDRLANEMGARARALACRKYSWAIKAEELEKIYLNLVF